MVKSLYVLCLVLSAIACTPEEKVETCSSIEEIAVQQGWRGCYVPGNGLTLIASGQFPHSSVPSFTWYVYPQISLEDRNLAPQFENVFLGTDLLTIPDSVLSDAPKFVVRVEPPNLDTTDDCQDQPVESDFYAFVRQNSSDTSCQTWVAQ